MAVFAAHRADAVGEAVNGFPNWAERVIHQWMNRARVDPQLEMNACGSNCVERSCYSVKPPLTWNQALNRAARFHSDAMVKQGFFAHDSACTLVSNIGSLYPTSCDGSASCACVGGVKACSPTCTPFWTRIERFGGSGGGEIIASGSEPNVAFYSWLYEPGDTSQCMFTGANGHRWLILQSNGAVGVGVSGRSTGDFGGSSTPTKIPSGSHYPRQAASVAMWANWHDTAGPSAAAVNVNGVCTPMSLQRGTSTNGAWSATITGAGSGCHRYYFTFIDAGGATVTYPTTGSLAIGSGAGCPDFDSTRPAACSGEVPTWTPTSTPLPSATTTATATRTGTATGTATRTGTVTATATRTPTFSATATLAVTNTPTDRDVSGGIRYYSNDLPVPGVNVAATSPLGNASAVTDQPGAYTLTDVTISDLLVRPNGSGGIGAAISALDATYVLQAVADLRELSPQQILACDVTGNGSVSTFDATLLLQYAVGLLDEFPVTTACGGDWAFIPDPAAAPNQTLIQPQPGTATCVPGGIAYTSLPASLAGQDFSAVLFGDCTGNWRPPAAAAVAAVQARADATNGRLRRIGGRRLALPIAVAPATSMEAIEIAVRYDPSALRPVRARLVGRARGASLAFNPGRDGIARLAIASARPIRADGRPLAVVIFEPVQRGRTAAPAVTITLPSS